MYQPYPQKKFESLNPDWRFQEIAQHICLQAESPPCVTDLACVAALPAEARTIYFLWMFNCEAGGGGLEVFLLEPQGIFTSQVHEALRVVGASELVERLEAGIPHALASGCAEFSASTDLTWFRQFSASPKYPTLQSVDAGIADLVGDTLRDKANAFIEAQRGVLVA